MWLWRQNTFSLIAALLTLQCLPSYEYVSRHFTGLDKWHQSRSTSSEYIPSDFYNAMRLADQSKQSLHNQLRSFLENLQKNLTTSKVLGDVDGNYKSTLSQMKKLYELPEFFYATADIANALARDSEQYFEVSKNCSSTLLLKLRQIPSSLPTSVKLLLTNYFEEMEFFHITFSEILDEALEYTQNAFIATQKAFVQYADVQQFVLDKWNFKGDATCCKEYMEFLQFYSAQIFKCAAGSELTTAYDVFAMTEMTGKYIIQQLEFRIQRIFNCLLFGNYEIRCTFLKDAEQDFQPLLNKIDELKIFYDIRIKHGRVSAYRLTRRGTQIYTEAFDDVTNEPKCLPDNFPHNQMQSSLKSCFNNIVLY
ncbi:uncharacterized protein LOC108604225 [Drosophila busckii]|uniref:uncharacterized protein LOC108604225 n=1 Tax=Drosophila busckii TaxID=30019 RepID=UPI00083F0526|nr:uncharacterized protein LOC108604225 [Drosophila busckii]